MFWGGTDSSSYSLHRDHADGDLFTYVLGGCKEMVVLANNDGGGDAVDDTLIQDTTAYGLNVFDHAAMPGVGGAGLQNVDTPRRRALRRRAWTGPGPQKVDAHAAGLAPSELSPRMLIRHATVPCAGGAGAQNVDTPRHVARH